MSRTGMPRREAELMLQRASEDAAWLAVLRDAYHGRHDVLDALWWAAHPLTESPQGRPDPASGVAELQRAVFSRSAAQEPRVEFTDPVTGARGRLSRSEARLRELQGQLDADAAQLWQALAALEPKPLPAAPASASDKEFATGEPPDAGQATTSEPGDGAAAGPGVPGRRKTRAITIGLAIAVAALLLPGIPNLVAGLSGESPAQPAVPENTPDASTMTAGGTIQPPLDLLADPSQEVAVPLESGGVLPVMHNFRVLPQLMEHVTWYLANGEEGDICLLATTVGGTSASSCASTDDFRRRGLSLSVDGSYVIGSVTRTVSREHFELRPDGEFSYIAEIVDVPRD